MGTARTRNTARIAWAGFLLAALVGLPLSARAADVWLNLEVERKPVVLLQGMPNPPHKLVLDMVKRTVGRTDFASKISSGARYRYAVTPEPDGQYRIGASSLQLTEDFTLTGRVTIKYPRLSNAQFNAVRNHDDYRFVYGLIQGIVRHEEEHTKEFVRFVRTVRLIYASPPLGDTPVVRPRDGEQVADAVSRFVNDRLKEAVASARRTMNTKQRKIDDAGKTTRLEFHFTEPAGGASPPVVTYETKGRLTVKLEVPKGNPRPPEPRTKY